MVFFKPHARSLSEQLDNLARLASKVGNRDDDSDLEAQTSRRSLEGSIKSGSMKSKSLRYGATDDVSMSSLRPLISFGPRSEESEVLSIYSDETRPRSPQQSFQSLAPLPRPSVFASALSTARFVWNRMHSSERRSLGVFHKCLLVAFLALLAGSGYVIFLEAAKGFVCWAQAQLGWAKLPFCEEM
ncbi:uncharacterized protein CXQ87_004552 [Candidozyma duobushaemuli]|uniref:Uncharacterized protein n=1 Tax=Candidozyma duobushaemuli TaxID=1231522 RepID=A0A2V1AHA3_9ASCO|nr:uncharacterized protein CXQ87_004552 [[Candida] duobushaemulonis]PVH16994.1 hypothetical protein CXQ87_004552 [[Candida] duobushaemulonis]